MTKPITENVSTAGQFTVGLSTTDHAKVNKESLQQYKSTAEALDGLPSQQEVTERAMELLKTYCAPTQTLTNPYSDMCSYFKESLPVLDKDYVDLVDNDSSHPHHANFMRLCSALMERAKNPHHINSTLFDHINGDRNNIA